MMVPISLCYSFIHSGHFYSTSSSPLLLRGAPDYSINTVSELTQLRVKDSPKAPTWWLEQDSDLQPSRHKTSNLPLSHHVPQTHIYIYATHLFNTHLGSLLGDH